MSAETAARPTTTTMDVESLVGMAWNGEIRVPHFQRGFRWSYEDVRRLFDSIAKGYPVGSLLLWLREAPAQPLKLGDLTLDAPKMTNSYWVVDGQQRITSLANALRADLDVQSQFAIGYDVRTESFIKLQPKPDPYLIPLGVVFDLQRLLRWFANNPMIADYLDVATSIARRIRQYEIPAYLVAQDDAEVLRDIFDRMNNYGKRLTRAEVFSALNAGDESDSDQLTFDTIANDIDTDTDFGIIDANTVLASILAPRGADVRRDIRSEFENESKGARDAAYQSGAEALLRAVAFLQKDANVPHVSMLAYRYPLVVLARFFAYFPTIDPRTRRLLRRWYWRAAVAGPEQFKGGTPNAARVLCTRVQPHEETESLIRLIDAVSNSTRSLPDFSAFNTASANTKMLLCSMWSRSPRDPITGEEYNKAQLAEGLLDSRTARPAIRTITPRGGLSLPLRRGAGNRVLMPELETDSTEIISLLSQAPLDLSDDEFDAVLRSHSISSQMHQFLQSDQFEAFVELRQEQLASEALQFLSAMCEYQFEDTPPLSAFQLDDEPDADDSDDDVI